MPSAAASEEFWDARYRSAPAIWSGNPNPHLVADAGDLTPGRALDIGAGEGADAIWLAQRGWTVTAVDISGVALQRARAEAERHGPPLFQRCIDAVAVGGTLLIVGHDESDLQTTIRRPPQPDLYFHAATIATDLGDQWTVVEAGTRGRTARDADDQEVAIRDAVLVARRKG